MAEASAGMNIQVPFPSIHCVKFNGLKRALDGVDSRILTENKTFIGILPHLTEQFHAGLEHWLVSFGFCQKLKIPMRIWKKIHIQANNKTGKTPPQP